MTDQSAFDDYLRAKVMLRRNILRNWIFITATSAVGLYCIFVHLTLLGVMAALMAADAAYMNGRMQGMLDLTDEPE